MGSKIDGKEKITGRKDGVAEISQGAKGRETSKGEGGKQRDGVFHQHSGVSSQGRRDEKRKEERTKTHKLLSEERSRKRNGDKEIRLLFVRVLK